MNQRPMESILQSNYNIPLQLNSVLSNRSGESRIGSTYRNELSIPVAETDGWWLNPDPDVDPDQDADLFDIIRTHPGFKA